MPERYGLAAGGLATAAGGNVALILSHLFGWSPPALFAVDPYGIVTGCMAATFGCWYAGARGAGIACAAIAAISLLLRDGPLRLTGWAWWSVEAAALAVLCAALALAWRTSRRSRSA